MKFFNPNIPKSLEKSLERKKDYNFEENLQINNSSTVLNKNEKEENFESELGYYTQSNWLYIFYLSVIISPNLLWLLGYNSKSFIIAVGLTSLVVFLLGIVKIYESTVYLITNNDFVIYTVSLLNRTTTEIIPYQKIKHLELKTNFLGWNSILIKLDGEIEWKFKIIGLNKEDSYDIYQGLQKILQFCTENIETTDDFIEN